MVGLSLRSSLLAGALLPLLVTCVRTPLADDRLIEVSDSGRELGTSYDVVVRTTRNLRSRAEADLAEARDLCRELEAQLSEWRPDSEISEVNRWAAREAVRVSEPLLRLIQGAAQVSQLTGGAFDITWKPLGNLWDAAAASGRLPGEGHIEETLAEVGWRYVSVTDGSVRFQREGVQLGIAGVAKGWIIDAVFLFLRDRGYEHIIVNIGGDLRTCGRGPGDGRRTFLIADPHHPDRSAGLLEVDDTAIATSGNYLRRREIEGQLIGHILDPRTGRPPAFTGSVTVLTRDAAMADALATALFVMGPAEGLALARRLDGVDAVFVTPEGTESTLSDTGGAGRLLDPPPEEEER